MAGAWALIQENSAEAWARWLLTVAGAMTAVLPVFRAPPGGGQVIVPGGHLAGGDRRDALVPEPGGDPGAQPQREVFLVAEVVEQGSGGVREFVDPEELGQWTGQVRAEVTALRPATEASAPQGPPNDAPPQVVWVLQRWDRHADEISPHSDEACALAEPARHVRTGVHAV
ncbi:hypothetical protein [Nonomuraea sp. NPDC049709]|uniref:hypothetical protein n=1 Tax=Nonomuraea sp. NPDC049709 TaxID=3154736 RepID=UPI00341CB239